MFWADYTFGIFPDKGMEMGCTTKPGILLFCKWISTCTMNSLFWQQVQDTPRFPLSCKVCCFLDKNLFVLHHHSWNEYERNWEWGMELQDPWSQHWSLPCDSSASGIPWINHECQSLLCRTGVSFHLLGSQKSLWGFQGKGKALWFHPIQRPDPTHLLAHPPPPARPGGKTEE